MIWMIDFLIPQCEAGAPFLDCFFELIRIENTNTFGEGYDFFEYFRGKGESIMIMQARVLSGKGESIMIMNQASVVDMS